MSGQRNADKLRRDIERAASRFEEAASELKRLDAGTLSAEAWLNARARMGQLIAGFREAASDVDRTFGQTSAHARLTRYLQLHVGEPVGNDELSGVAGTLEWARRLRELREDMGWVIHSNVTRDDLRPGEYVLVVDHPQPEVARIWAAAKEKKALRGLGGPATTSVRLLEFLKAIYPLPADREQMAHVTGSSDATATAVEILQSQGWDIGTCPASHALAPGGHYLLTDPRPTNA